MGSTGAGKGRGTGQSAMVNGWKREEGGRSSFKLNQSYRQCKASLSDGNTSGSNQVPLKFVTILSINVSNVQPRRLTVVDFIKRVHEILPESFQAWNREVSSDMWAAAGQRQVQQMLLCSACRCFPRAQTLHQGVCTLCST